MNTSVNEIDQTPLLLNVGQAAQKLSVSKWTLYELMHQGVLPRVKIQSRRFIASADLDEYVKLLRVQGEDRHGL